MPRLLSAFQAGRLVEMLTKCLDGSSSVELTTDHLAALMPDIPGRAVAHALTRSGIGRRMIRARGGQFLRWIYLVESERLADVIEPIAERTFPCPVCQRAVSRRGNARMHSACVMIASARAPAAAASRARGRQGIFARHEAGLY